MLRFLGNANQPLLAVAERLFSRYKPAFKPEIPAVAFEPIPRTPNIDQIVAALHRNAQTWADLKPEFRAALLRECIKTTMEVAEEAATAATAHKGSFGGGIGEELLSFVPIVSALREYAEALEAGGAGTPHRVYQRPGNGQWVADVFPVGIESLLFAGLVGELWIEPGKEPTQGKCYREPTTCPPGVGVVLGAGNQTPVVALDILHVLVTTNKVVCCKMNPVYEVMGPYLRRAFQPLVDNGFLEFIYGGEKEGSLLCNHPQVSAVHLTGSEATYNAIMWQGQEPKKGVEPPFTKPVDAELGCVTPYIIVPGKWSRSDMEYHAENVITGLTQNAGHNCLAAEILVTDAAWPQRELFLEILRGRLAATATRVGYYPGTGKKAAAFKKSFLDADEIGGRTKLSQNGDELVAVGDDNVDSRRLPWILKLGLTPEQAITDVENWCGVFQEVVIPGTSNNPAVFLEKAVKFANEKCWGTLSCVVIAHPATQKAIKKEFEAAIEGLKYGTICINVPGGVGYGITKLAWGGWPGSTADSIGSGNCKVQNTLLYDHVQKSVVRGAWRIHPYPFWLTSNRNTEAIAKESMKFMAKPSLAGINPVAAQALRG
jgi:acyl-CoA reductase-like NAD-dependent aldehyde dehydrogenase